MGPAWPLLCWFVQIWVRRRCGSAAGAGAAEWRWQVLKTVGACHFAGASTIRMAHIYGMR